MVDDTSGAIDPGTPEPGGPAHDVGALAAGVPEQALNVPEQARLGPAIDPAWSTAPPPPPPIQPPPASGWVLAPVAPVVREVAPGLVFASTGRRLGAWLIDWIIALLLTGLVEVPVAAAVRPHTEPGIVLTLAAVALAYLVLGGYFVLGWRSRARGTPGMRMLRLQIGNAFDGRTLTLGQSIRRWISIGYPLYLLTAIPGIGGLATLASLALGIVLLLTTISSATKQGLHDRIANSAMVAPVGHDAGDGAALGTILVVIALLLIVPVVAILALLFLGSQISTILSGVGSPAP